MNLAAHSTAWQNPAIGVDGPDFINAAVLVLTRNNPSALKYEILRPLETQLGRMRSSHTHAPRPIDLDLLITDGEVMEPDIWRLAYLAVPLAEIFPDCTHPITGEKLSSIAKKLAQPTKIYPRPDILRKTTRILPDFKT